MTEGEAFRYRSSDPPPASGTRPRPRDRGAVELDPGGAVGRAEAILPAHLRVPDERPRLGEDRQPPLSRRLRRVRERRRGRPPDHQHLLDSGEGRAPALQRPRNAARVEGRGARPRAGCGGLRGPAGRRPHPAAPSAGGLRLRAPQPAASTCPSATRITAAPLPAARTSR